MELWVIGKLSILFQLASTNGRKIQVNSTNEDFLYPSPSGNIFYTYQIFEPAHETVALFVLRKLILQTRMRSHRVGLDVWFLVGPFVYFHTLCVRIAKALARLRGCAGSPELSLVDCVIGTIISWDSSFLKSNERGRFRHDKNRTRHYNYHNAILIRRKKECHTLRRCQRSQKNNAKPRPFQNILPKHSLARKIP